MFSFFKKKKDPFTVRIKEYEQPRFVAGMQTPTTKRSYRKDVSALQTSFNGKRDQLQNRTNPSGTMVIFIAFPKYYYPLGSIAKNAVSRGTQLLTITDSISSPTVQYSKYLLVCHTSTRVFYNSLTLPMAMANLLLSYLVIDLGPDYRSRDLTNAVQEQILREQDSADSTEK